MHAAVLLRLHVRNGAIGQPILWQLSQSDQKSQLSHSAPVVQDGRFAGEVPSSRRRAKLDSNSVGQGHERVEALDTSFRPHGRAHPPDSRMRELAEVEQQPFS